MKEQLILVDIDMYYGYMNAFIQEESNSILGRGIKIESPKDEFNFREWADDNDLEYEMYGDDELIDSSWGYTYYIPFDLYIKYLNENRDKFNSGGQTDAQKEKISYVMDEFKSGDLKTSYGTKVTDNKQAIAIALSEAGVDKKEDGGIIEVDVFFDTNGLPKAIWKKGMSRPSGNKTTISVPKSEWNKGKITKDNISKYLNSTPTKEDGGVIEGQLHSECNDDTGCGEKFNVSNSGRIIEAERDEAVIVSNAFNDNQIYIIYGSPSQIASALNVMGGGKNFDDGAEIQYPDGSKVFTSAIKNETNDSDVGQIDSGSVIINRRSMYDNTRYRVKGTPKQIASAINSVNGNGVIIDEGAEIKKA